MGALRLNIAANYFGAGWSALINLLVIPMYVRFMGIEAYGIIGLFGSLSALFGILDFGLSATMNREMARLSVDTENVEAPRRLTRTLEIVYWIMGGLIGVVIVATAGPLADAWITAERLSSIEVRDAFMLMAAIIAIRWPVSLYSGAFMGLQRQALLNGVTAAATTIRALGSLVVLWLISPTLHAFFIFQAVSGLLETLVLRDLLWRKISPKSARTAHFDFSTLKETWRFTAGMAGVGIVSVILVQTDKLLLSALLPLAEFGYYSLAWTIASAGLRLVYPVLTAFYPRLTQLAALGNRAEFSALFHKGSQFVTVMILPVSVLLVAFPDRALLLWTGDPLIAHAAGMILSALALGTCLNAFVCMPYVAQLALGATRTWLMLNIVALVLLVPGIVLLTKWYGVMGAACMWPALNLFFLVGVSIGMFDGLLHGTRRSWLTWDIGLPFVVVALIAPALWGVLPAPTSKLGQALTLSFAALVMCVGASTAAPVIRHEALRMLRAVTARVAGGRAKR